MIRYHARLQFRDKLVAPTRFWSDEQGLYLDARIIKAAIREAAFVLYSGLPGTRKAADRTKNIFIEPARIYLGRQESDGKELFGPFITLPPATTDTELEFVLQPDIAFDVVVRQDDLPSDLWRDIWTLAEDLGLGAGRLYGQGKFDVIDWDKAKE